MILEDERIFATFIEQLIPKLNTLYESKITYEEKLVQREKVFLDSLKEFDQLKGKLKTDRFRYFGSSGLNNAYLMAVGLYHRHFQLFEAVHKKNGNSVIKTLQFFQKMADREDDILERLQTDLREESFPISAKVF